MFFVSLVVLFACCWVVARVVSTPARRRAKQAMWTQRDDQMLARFAER
jgi:peptidoglycan/LPS O-acetylase OafA/YrhL